MKSGQARTIFQSADGAALVRHLRGVSRRRAFEARIRTARDGSSPGLTWIFAVLASQPPHSPTTPPEEPVCNFAHRRPRVSFGLRVRRRSQRCGAADRRQVGLASLVPSLSYDLYPFSFFPCVFLFVQVTVFLPSDQLNFKT